MISKVGQTVIGEGIHNKPFVGVVIEHRTFEGEGTGPVNLLKVRFQNSNSTTAIYLSTEHETRLLNNSPAPGLIRLLEK